MEQEWQCFHWKAEEVCMHCKKVDTSVQKQASPSQFLKNPVSDSSRLRKLWTGDIYDFAGMFDSHSSKIDLKLFTTRCESDADLDPTWTKPWCLFEKLSSKTKRASTTIVLLQKQTKTSLWGVFSFTFFGVVVVLCECRTSSQKLVSVPSACFSCAYFFFKHGYFETHTVEEAPKHFPISTQCKNNQTYTNYGCMQEIEKSLCCFRFCMCHWNRQQLKWPCGEWWGGVRHGRTWILLTKTIWLHFSINVPAQKWMCFGWDPKVWDPVFQGQISVCRVWTLSYHTNPRSGYIYCRQIHGTMSRTPVCCGRRRPWIVKFVLTKQAVGKRPTSCLGLCNTTSLEAKEILQKLPWCTECLALSTPGCRKPCLPPSSFQSDANLCGFWFGVVGFLRQNNHVEMLQKASESRFCMVSWLSMRTFAPETGSAVKRTTRKQHPPRSAI